MFMRTLFQLLLAIGALTLSGEALATCYHTPDGTDLCGPEPVQQLYVTANGGIYVMPTSSLIALPPRFGCTPVAGSYFALDPKSANYKQIYASLLSARMSGAPVTFVLDPAQRQCTLSYILF